VCGSYNKQGYNKQDYNNQYKNAAYLAVAGRRHTDSSNPALINPSLLK